MQSIRSVIKRRDGLSDGEVDELIAIARKRIDDGEDPEEVLAEEFGLEPDFIFDRELGVL